jgi:hypothetical protein
VGEKKSEFLYLSQNEKKKEELHAAYCFIMMIAIIHLFIYLFIARKDLD